METTKSNDMSLSDIDNALRDFIATLDSNSVREEREVVRYFGLKARW
jgi:hypothetical protein